MEPIGMACLASLLKETEELIYFTESAFINTFKGAGEIDVYEKRAKFSKKEYWKRQTKIISSRKGG